jgi:NADH dehydrogenase
MKTVCILGGTGFVGRHLAARLAQMEMKVRIPSRHPQRHRALRILPNVQVTQADIFNPQQLSEQFADCDVVINLVAVLNESRGGEFHKLHEELPKLVIDACYASNVSRLLHMSSLNSHPREGSSEYAKSKGRGEEIALGAEKLEVTSFRPSVIFGQDDAFFNKFAALLSVFPVFPLACPDAKFAPVWVMDVVEFMLKTINAPQTYGQAYELCGPEVYRLRELVEFTATTAGLKRWVMPLNDRLSRLQATMLGMLPGSPLTLDNYNSMQKDNVCTAKHFELFGIQPSSIKTIVPAYIGHAHTQANYDVYRYQARR